MRMAKRKWRKRRDVKLYASDVRDNCAKKDYRYDSIIVKWYVLLFLFFFPDHRDVSIQRILYMQYCISIAKRSTPMTPCPFRQCYATFSSLSSHYHLRSPFVCVIAYRAI